MPFYRKKPVVIEAVKVTRTIVVQTLEGEMTANPGDYLITGVSGEQYPCKPDIFEATYDPVDVIACGDESDSEALRSYLHPSTVVPKK